MDRLTELETIFEKFRMIGQDGITVHGSLPEGYAVHAQAEEGAGGTAGFPIIIPPPPETATGACCFDDGTCDIETESDCGDSGGTYQGDDTVCDPNPCPQPCPGCYFEVLGVKYLTKTVNASGTVDCPAGDPFGFSGTFSGSAVLDCSSGTLVHTCSGSGTDCRTGTDSLAEHLGECYWFLDGSPASTAPIYPVSCGLFDNACLGSWESFSEDCSGTCVGGCTGDTCTGSFTVTVDYSNPCIA